MRFHVVNLGCKVNKAESDSMSAHLLATGNELVGLDEADAIIINTCTVTGDAEKKTRKAVRRALRENTHARVMVTGCAAAISPDFYRALMRAPIASSMLRGERHSRAHSMRSLLK